MADNNSTSRIKYLLDMYNTTYLESCNLMSNEDLFLNQIIAKKKIVNINNGTRSITTDLIVIESMIEHYNFIVINSV